MARRPVGDVGRGSFRPLGSGSRFRGPLLGGRGPGTGAPAVALDQYFGRTKVLHNSFTTQADIADDATLNAITATLGTAMAKLKRLNIGAATGYTATIDGVSGGTAVPFAGVSVAAFTWSSLANEGAQLIEGGTGANSGFFPSNLASPARDYDPPLIITFGTDIAANVNGVNTTAAAVGLLSRGAANVSTAGANVGTEPGLFFLIPQGAAGVSGAVRCIYNSGLSAAATNQFDVTTTKTLTAAAGGSVIGGRFAIRLVVSGLSLASPPVFSNSYVEYWIDEVMVLRRVLTTAVPVFVNPGIAGVALGAGVGITHRVAYWTLTAGPVRYFTTTV